MASTYANRQVHHDLRTRQRSKQALLVVDAS